MNACHLRCEHKYLTVIACERLSLELVGNAVLSTWELSTYVGVYIFECDFICMCAHAMNDRVL